MSLPQRLLLAMAFYQTLAPAAEAQPRPAPPPGAIRFEAADHELIDRLGRENAVATSVPKHGVMDYLAHLGRRLTLWLLDLLRPLGRYAKGIGGAVGRTVVVIAFLTAGFLLFLGFRSLFRRRRPIGAPDPTRPAIPGPEPQPPSWDPARWRKELQNRIERSDVAGSLEALWWWLARSVVGTRVQDSWTSGDLLSSANRAGLREPVRRLERMMYGSRSPSLEEVLDLVRSLERQLA